MDNRAFADFLIADNLLDTQGLAKAKQIQEIFPSRLDTILAATGIVAEDQVEKALGRFLKARTVGQIELDNIDPQVTWILSPRVVRRFKAMPFRKEGQRLSVVSLEPLDLLVEDELAMLTGCMINSYIAVEFRVMECLSNLHDFDLSPQLDSIIKKMRGRPSSFSGIAPVLPRDPGQRDEPAVATPVPAAPAAPTAPSVLDSARTIEPPAAAEQAPPPQPYVPEPSTAEPEPLVPEFTEVDELEMDEEDLALFPTLGSIAISEGEGAGEAVPEAPPAPTPPPPPPPCEPEPEPAPEAPAEPPEPPPTPEVVSEPVPVAEPEPVPPPEQEPERSPDEQLAIAATRFQDAEMRDDIGDAILDFCKPYLKRRMLLVVRKGCVVGWRGEGEGIDEMAVRAISIPLEEPSVFVPLTQGTAFWLGALPPMPRNVELVFGLGGEQPRDCVILPVKVRDRIVCFLFGDNRDDGVAGVPMGPLRRLVAKAGLAFQVYIMKSKIRLI